MKRIVCPICGVTRGKPFIHIPSTPYSSECSCSDASECMYHKLHLDEIPKRPSDEELRKKAEGIYESKLRDFEEAASKYQSIEKELEAKWASGASWMRNQILVLIEDKSLVDAIANIKLSSD